MKKNKVTKEEKRDILILLWIFFITSLFLVFLAVIQIFIEEPNINCIEIYRTRGESMLPTIKNDSLVMVDKCATTYSVGDMVIFNASEYGEENPVGHRIIAIEGDRNVFVPKGDNNTNIDGIFTADKLMGKIIQIYNVSEVIYLK